MKNLIWLPRRCVHCRAWVEEVRRCWAHPTCYACAPPPPPLKTIMIGSFTVD